MRNFILQRSNRRIVCALAAACLAFFAAFHIHINIFAEIQTEIYRPIVALVNFSDSAEPFTADNRDACENIFNSAAGGTDEANLQSYLRTVSRGKIDYRSEFVIITLEKPASHYQNWEGGGLAPIFTDAIADSELVDFVNGKPENYFDANGDGNLDGLTFYVNAETVDPKNRPADAFWPHQGTNNRASKLGAYDVSKYMVIPKAIEGESNASFLQVICHETLHMFGADDLYHYNEGYEDNPAGFDSLHPVGIWDIMGTPKDYENPISVNTYYRHKMGFLDDTAFVEATPDTPYEIQSSLSQTGVVGLKFGEKTVNGEPEFFVLELRNFNESYDRTLKGILTDGYTVYRVRPSVATGNRIQRNGDEIVYLDENLSDDLSARANFHFAASFRSGILEDLPYSDGSVCNLRVELDANGATVREIDQTFAVSVTFGDHPLESFVVSANGEPLVPASPGVYTARRGSRITVSAEGYVLPEGTFELSKDTPATVSLSAFREKIFRFSAGETRVSGIVGAVGTRVYRSDENGEMRALLATDEEIQFSSHGFEFSETAYAFDEATVSEPAEIALTATARTVQILLPEGVASVSVSVNGGEASLLTAEEGVILIENVKNGDRILLSTADETFEEILVSHLVTDDRYAAARPAPEPTPAGSDDLIRLSYFWLALPVGIFLIVFVCVLAHDYRRKRG